MSERSRKKARREARNPKPVAIENIAPAPAPSQRSKFRVARVQRQVASQLGMTMRNITPERRQADKAFRAARLLPDEQPELSAPPAKAAPTQNPFRKAPPQLSMAREQPKLKCPPKDNSPKGSGGSGRSFIPWNKNC